MEIFQKGLYQYKRTDSGFVVINLTDNSTQFELFHIQKKKTNKKLGCLFAILALIISSDLDFDTGISRVNTLTLKKSKFDNQVKVKRVRKGIVITDNENKIGSILFKKRELICKYTIKVKNKILGELVSENISYSKMILNNNRTIAKLTKSSKNNNNNIGTIELFENLTSLEFKVLIGSILFWV